MLSQAPNANFPGQIWLRQPDGSHRLVEDTPANRQVVKDIELRAAQSQPLGATARLQDYDAVYPTRTTRQFTQWRDQHGIPVREWTTLEIEARLQGKPFTPDMQATDHEPTVPEPNDDLPISRRLAKKVKRILDSSSLDGMQVSGGSSLESLEDQGIVAYGMGEAEFYARLKKVMGQPDASRLAFQAHEAGWFAAGIAPERSAGEHPYLSTPNGSTFHEHNSDWPMKHHLPASRIDNLQASTELASVRKELAGLTTMVQDWLREKRALRGRVEG